MTGTGRRGLPSTPVRVSCGGVEGDSQRCLGFGMARMS